MVTTEAVKNSAVPPITVPAIDRRQSHRSLLRLCPVADLFLDGLSRLPDRLFGMHQIERESRRDAQ